MRQSAVLPDGGVIERCIKSDSRSKALQKTNVNQRYKDSTVLCVSFIYVEAAASHYWMGIF